MSFLLELGVEAPKVLTHDQPKDTEGGELVLGVGGGGLQARFSEAKKALPKILREHEEKLALAKRFAMEQSVQHVSKMILCSLSYTEVANLPGNVWTDFLSPFFHEDLYCSAHYV